MEEWAVFRDISRKGFRIYGIWIYDGHWGVSVYSLPSTSGYIHLHLWTYLATATAAVATTASDTTNYLVKYTVYRISIWNIYIFR